MVLSYPVFFLAYAAAMVVATMVGLLLLVGWKDMWWRKSLISLKYNAVYVMLIAALPLIMLLQDLVVRHLLGPGMISREIQYTNWIFSLSGGVVTLLQDRLNYSILTSFFIVMYAWVFTFIVYFAPLLLLVRDDRLMLRKYAIAIILTYIIIMPFYALFPVSVTSSVSDAQMAPLLYADPHWGRLVTSIDPLDNDFPSGHVSLTVTTFLVFASGGIVYRKFAYFLGAATLSIVFAVLYLGIHWPADVFAGFLVAIAATVAARTDRIQMTIDRWVRYVSERILKIRPIELPEKEAKPTGP